MKYCEVVGDLKDIRGFSKRIAANHPELDYFDFETAVREVYNNSGFSMKKATEWLEKNDPKGFAMYLDALWGIDTEWLAAYADAQVGETHAAAKLVGLLDEWTKRKDAAFFEIKTAKQLEDIMDKYDAEGWFRADEWECPLADENFEIVDYKSDDDFTVAACGDWQAGLNIRMVGYGEELKKAIKG